MAAAPAPRAGLRTRLALASVAALGLTTAGVAGAVDLAAATDDEPTPEHPAASAPGLVAEPVVVLHRLPQSVDAVTGARGATPAWLARSAGSLPAEAASAYLLAAATLHQVAPDCRVTAPLLAGLGRVVSDHGRLGGRAPAAGPDTDGGRLDHDPRHDRPVGPFRMLPATWTATGVDADGDGVRDPRDLDDAALAAGVYLCAAVRTGSPAARVDAALRAWDSTPGFAATVHRLAREYAGQRFRPAWGAGAAAPVQPRAEAVRAARTATVELAEGHREARSTGGTRTSQPQPTHTVAELRPVATPTRPASKPTQQPTDEPSTQPTPTPTPTPEPDPTDACPSADPTTEPSSVPTADPTDATTPAPTCEEPASEQPGEQPSEAPTTQPDPSPTATE